MILPRVLKNYGFQFPKIKNKKKNKSNLNKRTGSKRNNASKSHRKGSNLRDFPSTG